MSSSDKGEIPVEVAIVYNTSYSENLYSYVNNINTYEGGTHVAGFRRAMTRTLKAYADKTGILDKVKITARNTRKATVKIRRNPLLRFLSMIQIGFSLIE